VTTLRPVVAQ
jgi:hypothetical protein